MLLPEFALIPDIFDSNSLNNDQNLVTILCQILKGLSKYGLVANLNRGQWIKYVENRIHKLKHKDKVQTLLSRLKDRNRLVRHPKRMQGPPSNDLEWLELALESQRRIPFHGIIINQTDLIEEKNHSDYPFIDFNDALDSPQIEEMDEPITLKKCECDYRKYLAPILRHAKKLILLEPYFNYGDERWLKTLNICAELMGDRGHERKHERLKGEIHLHTTLIHQEKKPYDRLFRGHLEHVYKHKDKYLDKWVEIFKPLKERFGHKFKVYLWEKLFEKPHDRFIFTNQCGISIQGGLDCYTKDPNPTTWSLLGDKAWDFWLKRIEPSSNFYKLLGSKELE